MKAQFELEAAELRTQARNGGGGHAGRGARRRPEARASRRRRTARRPAQPMRCSRRCRHQARRLQPRRQRRPRCASSDAAPTSSTCCRASACAATRWRRPGLADAGARCCCCAARAAQDAVRLAERAGLAQALSACKRWPREPFKLSADPRERDLANPLLLTGGADLRRGVGGRQRRRVRARACPTAPRCRARWWATPGWWRWPGTALRALRRAAGRRAASRKAAKRPMTAPRLGRRGWPARRCSRPRSPRRRGRCAAASAQALAEDSRSTAPRACAWPSAPGTASCASRCCSATARAWSRRRPSKACCTRAMCSTRSAPTRRRSCARHDDR